jgi:hypothetical protein
MLRPVAVLLLSLLAITQPSNAQDLSVLSCEDPQLIAIMEDQLRTIKVEDGRPLTSYGVSIDKITKSVTTLSSASKLICTITVRLSGGSSTTLRGRYTFQQFSGGRLTARFSPF